MKPIRYRTRYRILWGTHQDGYTVAVFYRLEADLNGDLYLGDRWVMKGWTPAPDQKRHF